MPVTSNYDNIKIVTELITTLFTVISGIAAGIWVVIRFLDDRRKERELKQSIEGQRIEQQKIDEEGRRAERVATIMSDFGKTNIPEIRAWNILALAMYPEQSTRLLSMSLGQFDDQTSNALQLALISIGERALPDLIRLNRIAQLVVQDKGIQSIDTVIVHYDNDKLLERSKKKPSFSY